MSLMHFIIFYLIQGHQWLDTIDPGFTIGRICKTIC